MYNGYGYVPNYMQNIQPQQPIQSPQPQQRQIAFQDIRFVNEDEAKSFIVLNPNSRVLLLDVQNRIAWIKSTDSLGLSYTERYKFEKIIENQPKIAENSVNYVKKEDLPDFATKTDLKGIYDQIQALKKQIETRPVQTSAQVVKREVQNGRENINT